MIKYTVSINEIIFLNMNPGFKKKRYMLFVWYLKVVTYYIKLYYRVVQLIIKYRVWMHLYSLSFFIVF